MHERARTNFGSAGQDSYGNAGGAVIILAMEFTLAEARRREEKLSSCLDACNLEM